MNSNLTELEGKLKSIVGEKQVKQNEPMKDHTSFKIGGPADLFISPQSEEELIQVITTLEDYPINVYYLGSGCNTLVGDNGYRGIIVDLSQINDIILDGDTITASCGARNKEIAKTALENSLSGFEFASGIPGTIGGGTCMNAGAYGGEYKDVIETVRYLEDGEIKTAVNKECDFGYRQSIFKKPGRVVLSVTLKLKPGNKDEIKAKMDDLTHQRTSKQPLNYPSAGSTFKRPPGYFAGKLIEDNGFKGKQIGGAAISEKHCGFLINKDKATCQDVLDLIHLIQKTIKENEGVDLETEVIFIGEQL